ncbi:SDR family oxidoreductase [Puniceicoccales bacterium CK1056]|uniref:SDR family oxidoreductase n=1 Tax=Oceanipulchritudo coccoides TaxID=2706888 RepID=A0A6B2M4J9_9BACT|nr:SDR family oxidoreductase [Oceanipulchritudo coccoides]NDV63024.1 SDR family oxidoreductase [Oceanipulchritudo coccoides]
MKRILIIGASSGIGAAVARACAGQGWAVILHGRDEERLEEVRKRCLNDKDGGMSSVASECSRDGARSSGDADAGIELLLGDVVAWAEDPKSIPEIEPVQAIVWSAGICELAAGQMLGLKAIRRTLSVNLEAPLVVLSHFYRKGIIQSGGSIVLLGSESAHDAGEGFSVYAASKGGLASAARVLGKEFQRRNVSVHCLEPGTVNTPMTEKLVQAFGGLKDGHMEKMVEPEEVAAEVVGILSSRFRLRCATSDTVAKASQDKHGDTKPQS